MAVARAAQLVVQYRAYRSERPGGTPLPGVIEPLFSALILLHEHQ